MITETNRRLGVEISNKLRWDGDDIVAVFRAALENSNYHTFNAAVEAMWQVQVKAEQGWEDKE
tara:strand:+ start:353 stop:541 length:189 start_codon:yes stop_codon:yes gene_type:complete